MNIVQRIPVNIPAIGLFLIQDVDLTALQTIAVKLPLDRKLALTRMRVAPKSIDIISGDAVFTLKSSYPTRPVAAVLAALTTALTGSNNDMVFTAIAGGVAGNAVTVAYVNPGTPSATLSVSATGSAVTVNLATGAGTAQVETATASGTIATSGNISVTVTGVGIAGTPLTIPVAALITDTAATWAGKVRTAMAATAAVTALYTVGGASTSITLTRTVATANDGTLNIALADGTSVGVNAAATSANTTAGVAPAITSTAALVKSALQAYAAFNNLMTVANASANDGTGVVTALTATALTGGADATAGTLSSNVLTLTAANLTTALAAGNALDIPLAVQPVIGPEGGLQLEVTTGGVAVAETVDILLEGILY